MPKFIVSILLLFANLLAVAQVKTVKEAEHMMAVAKPDHAAVLKKILPALENDETKENPEAWMIAGKSALGVWDKMMLSVSLGQNVSADVKKNASHKLIDAYTYFTKAMSLDSLPDGKGKIKPKHSKEIVKTLGKVYRSYRNAGIFLYDLKDYAGAYDAWEIYLTMPDKLDAKHKVIKPDNNSDLGQIYYYQALCALTTDKNQQALEKLGKSRKTGFSSRELYLYAVEASRRLGNDSVMLDYARVGAELYGKEEVSFILLLINDRLKNDDFVACRSLAEEALKSKSDDKIKSQLYNVIGVVDDHDGNFEGALANFQKAVVYDESNAKAYFDLARVIYNEALKIAENESLGGLDKAKPGLIKAAEYFEKAYALDPQMIQIPATLYSIYYRLGVGYEQQASRWQKLQ
ncbi:MAG: hypothetical protein NC338_06705 [Firmicutes bacterium]|nr:hypothetical protein [Bacillota bacterium]MCM1401567.1 hypothetical protein [Bacteroides sp.]MCM1477261.1 hypothetical protein [Bacteroides sp.]